MEAYCVKCKEKRTMASPEATFTRTGTPATRGKCEVCGTNLYKMGRTEAHEGLSPPLTSQRNKRRKAKSTKGIGNLVIVESPAKARTVERLLGKEYKVKASVGHVRDLLKSQLSVDVDNNYEPKYRVPNEKRATVKELQADMANAGVIYLATDPDREGEAIAWHLVEASNSDPAKAKRVVFHEITPSAIQNAFSNLREIDMNLVDAQQARRILDRLVGYNISPILWTKVRSRLSAGRVQSAALRLIVEREREIVDFIPEEYWTIDAEFQNPDKPPAFKARLTKIDTNAPELKDEVQTEQVLSDMHRAAYSVEDVKRGNKVRRPVAPFTTSTLQQDASRAYRYTARKTMAIAQQLYEGVELGSDNLIGLITYIRTDSTQVSKEAQLEARSYIKQNLGVEYLPDQAPFYKTKSKAAQEAHEAIRPTSVFREPDQIRAALSPDQYKLYNLIWKRFLASQMNPAEYDTHTILIAGSSADHAYSLRVTASKLRFAGFLRIYEEQRSARMTDESKSLEEADQTELPELEAGDKLDLKELFPEQHFTQPPPRYSDATLVKDLEELGIGRPSTYAPTISTISRRGYVEREKRRLVPTETGILVNDLVVEHFPDVVDYGFTARLEDQLDQIAEGDREWAEVIHEFYVPFSEQVNLAWETMPDQRAEPEYLDRNCPETGHQLVIRYGRYGKFIGCSDFPNCRYTEPWLEKIGILCPKDGGDIVERRTRKGRAFFGCSNYPECDFTSWKRPVKFKCPECNGQLVENDATTLKCMECQLEHDKSIFELHEPDMA